MKAIADNPAWKQGEPNAPGLWIIQGVAGEFDAWLVTWDRDDDEDGGERYLRFEDHETSEPLSSYPWPPVRSFGPIKVPGNVTQKMRDGYVKVRDERLAKEP